ncbi:MAG TPA: aldose 1-epimerase [Dongiaceae bacterium]|nr:aldose 1-epimerase [Dongiaceae bacterium]
MGSALIEIASGPLRLRLAPAIGGAIAGFSYRGEAGTIDLLRPMDPAALAASDVLGASCFPLSPFSNRLRDGRFRFRGREVQLPLNSDGPHNEHGHGWQRPWLVETQTPAGASLLYRHAPDDWPFAYEMRQHFRLTDTALTISLASRNTGPTAMPYGFGLHPYFARTPRCRMIAPVDGFWATDAEVMPTALLPVPAAANLRQGIRLDEVELDNVFTGWSGEAVITWPEHRLQLAMSASPPLRCLVVYAPKGEPYFCAEPVSNITDAFNLCDRRDDTGMLILEPGAEVRAAITFTLSPSPL